VSLWGEVRDGIFKEMCLSIKLKRGGLVMVNLDFYFNWIEKHLGDNLQVCL
jgi:hypothetical protein